MADHVVIILTVYKCMLKVIPFSLNKSILPAVVLGFPMINISFATGIFAFLSGIIIM